MKNQLKITVKNDGLSMDQFCPDEKKIWELWSYKEQQVRNMKEYYSKRIEYKGQEHQIRVLFDGIHCPKYDVGGFLAHEIIEYIEKVRSPHVADSKTSDRKSLVNEAHSAFKELDPSLQKVCIEVLQSIYKILASVPPGTSLTIDSRNCFYDGRKVMRLVEQEFDKSKNRKINHLWVFTDNNNEFEFNTNC
ncbi:MAG: hypothetical protein QME64_05560 [bacterium]|nr:hypothetical protein [bacterium]